MTGANDALRAALDRLATSGDPVAVEPEGFPLLEAMGITCPRCVTIEPGASVDAGTLASLRSPRVVVKLASSQILHRSDLGAVAIVSHSLDEVREAIRAIQARVPDLVSPRFTVSEFVSHEVGLGGELLVSLRWTSEFGPVVTVGPGGVYAELLSNHLRPGDEVAVCAAAGLTRDRARARLARLPFVQAITGGARHQRPVVSLDALVSVVMALAALGDHACPAPILECEINPLVATPSGLVAVDVLVRMGTARQPVPAPRPLHKMRKLLEPRSVAIAGVSEQMNPGHHILRNLLAAGFPPAGIQIVKPRGTAIDGCAVVPSLAQLEPAVDLLVLAVSAAHAPAMLRETIEGHRAESVIVIPGGLEEKAGGAEALAPVHEALGRARGTAWGGPIINGGNCLGIRSLPGRCDTFFIPQYKMPPRPVEGSPVALVLQSGALAIASAGRLGRISPMYLVTVGNQMDLTIGDYLSWWADDPNVRVVGVYAEGFRPGDGRRVMEAARAIRASGRLVILYRGGRTSAGAVAMASHTASMAGDYVATRELAADAGILMVDSLEDFEDALLVATAFDGRPPRGLRLGAVSNAGLECVAMADNLGPFALARWSAETSDGLRRVFQSSRLDGIVDVRNPLDLSPMAGDETFANACALVMADPGVDLGVVGCVPMTPALETLAAAPGHGEDVTRSGSVAARLARLWQESRTPWVAVVHTGPQYAGMVQMLTAAGVPTFSSADRALRILAAYVRALGITSPH